jgi:hypothetical protein
MPLRWPPVFIRSAYSQPRSGVSGENHVSWQKCLCNLCRRSRSDDSRRMLRPTDNSVSRWAAGARKYHRCADLVRSEHPATCARLMSMERSGIFQWLGTAKHHQRFHDPLLCSRVTVCSRVDSGNVHRVGELSRLRLGAAARVREWRWHIRPNG